MHIMYLKTDISNKPLIAGGSVSHTVGVIQALCQLGHQVTVTISTPLHELTLIPGLVILHLHNPGWLKFLRWKTNCILSTFFFAMPVLRLIKKQQPDLIYQRYSPFNLTGAFVSWLTGIPLILEYNGSEVWTARWWASKTEKRQRFLWLMAWFEKKALKTADKIIVVSTIIQEEVKSLGIPPEKIVVAPNGVNPDLFDPARFALIRVAHRTQIAHENPFIIGFTGTFSSWHGVETLAVMASKLIRHEPSAYFLFIGDGPLLAWLKQELDAVQGTNNRIIFTGLIPPQQARDYLSMCDAFVCPTKPNADGTRFFGSPTKLFEYLSLGKPVISSNLEQLAQIIHPALHAHDIKQNISISNQVGILANPHDPQEFVAAAQALITMSSEQRERLGFNARQKVLQQYTWQQHAEKILEKIT
jgi:glycosyltransferase involved in cell wall biosynthesis